MIQAEHLQKIFRVRKRNAGFKNAAKAFFSREYEEIHALNDVSFRIEDGEAVGYIGPNGAGKSSTIKILSGILTPDSGTCVIDGACRGKTAARMFRRSALCSGSAVNYGGTCPSLIHSSLSATFTP